MRKLALGFAAVAAFGAIAGAGEAEAQGFSVTIGTPGYYAPVGPYYAGPPAYGYYGPPRRPRHWAPAPVYGAPYGYYRGPRCWVKPVTVWNGWTYVTQHRRVCR